MERLFQEWEVFKGSSRFTCEGRGYQLVEKRAYGHGPFGVNFHQVSIGFLEEQSKLLSGSYAAQADTSTSPGPQHASFAPHLHTSTSTRLQPASQAPELHTSTSPRLPACSLPSELQSFIPLRLHACSPPPYVRTSSSLHLQHASGGPDLF